MRCDHGPVGWCDDCCEKRRLCREAGEPASVPLTVERYGKKWVEESCGDDGETLLDSWRRTVTAVADALGVTLPVVSDD